MENNEQNDQETNNEEKKTVLSAGTKVIAPIHDDIVPESPIHAPKNTNDDKTDTDESDTPDVSDEHSPSDEGPKETPAVVNDAIAAMPTAPATPIATPARSVMSYDQPEVKHGLAKRLFGETKAYLAEYVVQLVLLASLLVLASTFFAAIIDPSSDGKSWASSWQYQLSIGQLAAVVAIVPLLVIIARRTAGTEADAPLVRESGWRKAFLGIFLIVIGLAAVGYAIQFVYIVLSMMFNAGLAVDAVENPTISLLQAGFSALAFGISALLYAKDYRKQSNKATILQAIHRYGLIVFTVILGVMFALMPLQKQRSAYVDTLKVGDLQQIERAVSTYSVKNKKLPEKLEDLELSDEVKTRNTSLRYEYKKGSGSSYELCTNFATDAREDEPAITSVSPLNRMAWQSGANYNELYPADSESPAQHKDGYQCFKYTASGVRSTQTLRQTPVTTRSSSSTSPSTQSSSSSSDDALFEAFSNGESLEPYGF